MVRKATVNEILSVLKSGLALDVAKNHTGVVIWDGTDLKTYGFAIKEYDKDDCFAEYKMRRDFKQKLSELVHGKQFEHCVIEDVYGGVNFDTVRKLLALNTVIDELIFEGVCIVDNFHRLAETTWMKQARQLYTQTGRLNPKVEIQGLLENFGWEFYMKNANLPEARKKDIFFEDICDACGMLLGVAANKLTNVETEKKPAAKMSNVKMYYISSLLGMYSIQDSHMDSACRVTVDLDYRNLEKSILSTVSLYPEMVAIAKLPPNKLGTFGIKYKLKFFDSDEGYLVFYDKRYVEE